MRNELPNIAACAYQGVHVWGALLTCAPPPPRAQESPCERTSPWLHGTFPDTTFFLAENWVFMAAVDVGVVGRRACGTNCDVRYMTAHACGTQMHLSVRLTVREEGAQVIRHNTPSVVIGPLRG